MSARRLHVRTLEGGLRLAIDPADRAIGPHILRNRYELNELDFVRGHVLEGQHVLDVGAHVGFYTVHMAAAVGPSGSVHAFEPLDESADYLERSVRANGFEDRVTVLRRAAGRRSGRAALVFAREWQNPGAAYIAAPRCEPPPGHQLRAVSIAALDDLALPRPIAFIKIDVEGLEAEVLEGARRLLAKDRPLVLSEVHPRPGASTDAVTLMRRLGYRCHRLGAGVPGDEIHEAPVHGAHVVFLPPATGHARGGVVTPVAGSRVAGVRSRFSEAVRVFGRPTRNRKSFWSIHMSPVGRQGTAACWLENRDLTPRPTATRLPSQRPSAIMFFRSRT